MTDNKSNKILTPHLHPSVFIAEGARIYGDVKIGKGSSVWFNAVIRGDEGKVTIGENTNIQDNAVIHSDAGAAVKIGNGVTVGHCAIIRGAVVGNNVSIGMNSTIMSYAVIGDKSLVGANTFVAYNRKFPKKSLIYGVPGQRIREIETNEEETIQLAVDIYLDLIKKYRNGEVSEYKG